RAPPPRVPRAPAPPPRHAPPSPRPHRTGAPGRGDSPRARPRSGRRSAGVERDAARRSRGRSRRARRLLLVLEADLEDLVGALAPRRAHHDLVADLAADQRTRQRAVDGDQALLQVGLDLAHDAVLDRLVRVDVEERDGGAEDHLVAAQPRDVDHLGAREPVLHLLDPALDVALLLLRELVLGVLGEVTVRARFLDLAD